MGKINSHAKNQGHRSNGSAMRVLTDTQTDGTDSITLTANAGGKKDTAGLEI